MLSKEIELALLSIVEKNINLEHKFKKYEIDAYIKSLRDNVFFNIIEKKLINLDRCNMKLLMNAIFNNDYYNSHIINVYAKHHLKNIDNNISNEGKKIILEYLEIYNNNINFTRQEYTNISNDILKLKIYYDKLFIPLFYNIKINNDSYEDKVLFTKIFQKYNLLDIWYINDVSDASIHFHNILTGNNKDIIGEIFCILIDLTEKYNKINILNKNISEKYNNIESKSKTKIKQIKTENLDDNKKKTKSKEIIKKKVSDSVKKRIAGKQYYKCNNKIETKLYGLENYKCVLWQKDDENKGSFDESGYEIDHIKEFSLSKDNSEENLQALCLMCHKTKTKRFLNKK